MSYVLDIWGARDPATIFLINAPYDFYLPNNCGIAEQQALLKAPSPNTKWKPLCNAAQRSRHATFSDTGVAFDEGSPPYIAFVGAKWPTRMTTYVVHGLLDDSIEKRHIFQAVIGLASPHNITGTSRECTLALELSLGPCPLNKSIAGSFPSHGT